MILDAYSQATGVPTNFPGYPAGSRALQLRDSQVASYFLNAFGRPERKQTCECERTEDANIAQTLHIANGNTLNDKLRDEKSIVSKYLKRETPFDKVVEDLFYRALSRAPSAAEKENILGMVAEVSLTEESTSQDPRQGIEDLAWALMSSKEFLFNH